MDSEFQKSLPDVNLINSAFVKLAILALQKGSTTYGIDTKKRLYRKRSVKQNVSFVTDPFKF